MAALTSLVVALALPLLVGVFGALATAQGVATWYQTLAKPAWTPPDWVFGPVWTALYLIMGLASWWVYRAGPSPVVQQALLLYGVHLMLNLAWSVLFFGLRRPDLALADIAALWLALLLTIQRFAAVRPVAGWCLLPHLAWVTFAAALNLAVWWRNR